MADLTAMLQAAAGNVAGGDYQISRSLRFNSADGAYLSRTMSTFTDGSKGTLSFWYKPANLSINRMIAAAYDGSSAYSGGVSFSSSNVFNIGLGGAGDYTFTTNAVFRDVSAWYHFLVVWNRSAAAADKIKVWVNGVSQTSSTTAYESWTSGDAQIFYPNSSNRIGRGDGDRYNNYGDGYLAEYFFIDGQALTPSDFGETDTTTGVWKPKEYTGTYGNEGFHLDFSDNTSTTTLGYDAAGSNDWTLNNFSVTAGVGNDSLVDSPTRYGTDTGAGGEVRGNYCTLNPLFKAGGGTPSYANGNLEMTAGGSGDSYFAGTTLLTAGKWYYEATITAVGTGGTTILIGVCRASDATTTGNQGCYRSSSEIYNLDGTAQTAGATYAANDVIGVAIDIDNGTVKFYKNNTGQGATNSFTFTAGTALIVRGRSDGANPAATFNFGQRPFAYTAPSGFKALVTTNLPEPTVVQGDDYFNTVLYTGTGSSQSITGVGFQPDFVWIKERSGVEDHGLYDAVRGVQQQLESNTTTDETTESTGLTAFGTNGFTVGALAQLNTSAETYVAWNWKESTTSKFDIVTYTGNGSARTISHNLGVVPNMIIVKARTTASTDQGWPVYHSANTANPETDYLLLNSNVATADLDTVWNDTAPTSSVFSVGTNALVNANNDTYVAYLFANVAGFSAFGSYAGNSSTDGPFVFTGFRPAFVLIKRSNAADPWAIFDAKRSTENVVNKALYTNSSGAEDVGALLNQDFLSNGFKLRNTDTYFNVSGNTYIYAAFASNPFKFALAR